MSGGYGAIGDSTPPRASRHDTSGFGGGYQRLGIDAAHESVWNAINVTRYFKSSDAFYIWETLKNNIKYLIPYATSLSVYPAWVIYCYHYLLVNCEVDWYKITYLAC